MTAAQATGPARHPLPASSHPLPRCQGGNVGGACGGGLFIATYDVIEDVDEALFPLRIGVYIQIGIPFLLHFAHHVERIVNSTIVDGKPDERLYFTLRQIPLRNISLRGQCAPPGRCGAHRAEGVSLSLLGGHSR